VYPRRVAEHPLGGSRARGVYAAARGTDAAASLGSFGLDPNCSEAAPGRGNAGGSPTLPARSTAVAGGRRPGRATDMSKRSPLDSALSAVAAGVFTTLAKLRRARGVHPHGIGFDGVLTLQAGPGLDLMPGLGPRRSVPAVVRLSRSFGFPRPLPDLLGVAVKLPDLHGPGRDQDFLLVSALDGRLSKYVPAPASRYSWRAYSSLLPYRSDGRIVLPGAPGCESRGRDRRRRADRGTACRTTRRTALRARRRAGTRPFRLLR
jgi:hypothetical protein